MFSSSHLEAFLFMTLFVPILIINLIIQALPCALTAAPKTALRCRWGPTTLVTSSWPTCCWTNWSKVSRPESWLSGEARWPVLIYLVEGRESLTNLYLEACNFKYWMICSHNCCQIKFAQASFYFLWCTWCEKAWRFYLIRLHLWLHLT